MGVVNVPDGPGAEFPVPEPIRRSVRATPESVADLRPVVAKIIETLRDLHARQHTTLVLAYLPMRTDFADERSARWRQAIREIAGSEVPFVDVVADLRTLPVEVGGPDVHWSGRL